MSSRTSVLVCRGCCCGTEGKHPDIDHRDHLARLLAAASMARSTKVWEVGCLGPCERSNVVVVRTEATRRWFGHLLRDDEIQMLVEWIERDAVGPPPSGLALHQFTPTPAAAEQEARW
jgi:predicted metal-binding protein